MYGNIDTDGTRVCSTGTVRMSVQCPPTRRYVSHPDPFYYRTIHPHFAALMSSYSYFILHKGCLKPLNLCDFKIQILSCDLYRYYDASTCGLDFAGCIEDIRYRKSLCILVNYPPKFKIFQFLHSIK